MSKECASYTLKNDRMIWLKEHAGETVTVVGLEKDAFHPLIKVRAEDGTTGLLWSRELKENYSLTHSRSLPEQSLGLAKGPKLRPVDVL